MPSVMGIFIQSTLVLVTFVHISNISAGVALKGRAHMACKFGGPWFARPNFEASCVAQYIRTAGPATWVAGSNSLELVSTLLSKINLSSFQVP